MIRTTTLVMALLAGAATAQEAGRWSVVSITEGGMLTEYDTRTVQRQDDNVTVWVRYTYLKSPPVVQGKVMHHSMQRQYFNCSSTSSAVYSITAYTEDGNVIATESYPHPSYDPVVPGSIGEQTLDAVCK